MALEPNKPNFSGRPSGGQRGHLFAEKIKPRDAARTVARILRYLGAKRLSIAFVFGSSLAATLISIAGTRMSGAAVDRFIRSGDLRGLASICAVLAFMYAVGTVFSYLQSALMIAVAQNTAADIRRDLFVNMQRLPLKYFDTHPSGDLMSRLTNDVDNVNMMLSQGVVQLFSGVVTVVGMLAAMLVLSPTLTAVALAAFPIMFLSTRLIVRLARPYFVAQQRELGRLNGFIEEMLSGQKTLALFSREESVAAQFDRINESYVASSISAQGLSGVMGPLNNGVNNLTYLTIAVAGGLLALRGQGVSVGVIFSFILYMRGFTRPVNEILTLANVIQSALAGAERVFEVIDEDKERDEPGAAELRDVAGAVELSGVRFSYVPGRPVLRGLDLVARSGQTVAIVGPTGAGKTTVINLLSKFYDFEGGRILVDGRDIQALTANSLRRAISVVLQDPFLFSVSVRENIRFGRPDADDAEVEEAARRARAHDFILQLPDGYDTVLADNGSNLSQGQRQLLSLARAIIADAAILILDEATSSVDTRTELLIQEALLTLMRGRTSFVIAHRLSTIRNADAILVIDGGRVVESGTHSLLLESGGVYARLYNSQYLAGVPT